MDVDSAIAVIHRRLGNRSGLDTQILAELQEAQVQAEQMPELPWWLVTKASSFSTTASTQTLAAPTDFLREMDSEDIGMWITDSEGDKHLLSKGSYRLLQNQYKDEENGLPEGYDLIGSTFYFFPIPDAAYTLDFFYYKKDTVLSAGGAANGWLANAPYVLIGAAGREIAWGYSEDQKTADRFDRTYREALRTLYIATVARKEAGGFRNRVEG